MHCEGPSIIQRNGQIFMSRPAAATGASYGLGLLSASPPTLRRASTREYVQAVSGGTALADATFTLE